MESYEANHSHWLDSHISPENTKWIAENLKGFDESVKKISKLIGRDDSSYAQPGDCDHKRPGLLSHIEEFSRLHQQLAEKYGHLIGEVQRNFPSLPQTQNFDIYDSGSPKASPMQTPDQKMGAHKSEEAVGFNLFLSSGGGSSDNSIKEGSDSSLSLSSVFDSESLNSTNNHLVSPLKNNNLLKIRENGGYEEQLLVLSKQLKSSEEEIASLKDELKKSESVTLLVTDLQAQLESVQSDFEIQSFNLEAESEKVLKLHNQMAELETQIWDSDSKTHSLSDELKVSREKLIQSEDENARLKYELLSEICEATNKILVRDNQIKELNVALSDANEAYCIETAKLHSEISSLHEKQALLKARVDSLEHEIKQQKEEYLTMKSFHEADNEMLKTEAMEKGLTMKGLANEFDLLKLKYDTLMAEKDRLNAQVDTLRAEVSSRADIICQMENKLSRYAIKHTELATESDWEISLTRARMEELVKEVERQRNLISDIAEEKREAIKQLCFSLDHYRSEYKEIRQAYICLNRHTVLASSKIKFF